MDKEEEIEKLRRHIAACQLIMKIHASNEALRNSELHNSYMDSILDEILESRKKIRKLENE